MAYAVDFVAGISAKAPISPCCSARLASSSSARSGFAGSSRLLRGLQRGGGRHRGAARRLGLADARRHALPSSRATSTVLPLMVCAITYFAVNTGLVAGAIAVTLRTPRRAPSTPSSSAPRQPIWRRRRWPALVALAMLHGVVLLAPLSSPCPSTSSTAAIRSGGRRWAGRSSSARRRSRWPSRSNHRGDCSGHKKQGAGFQPAPCRVQRPIDTSLVTYTLLLIQASSPRRAQTPFVVAACRP